MIPANIEREINAFLVPGSHGIVTLMVRNGHLYRCEIDEESRGVGDGLHHAALPVSIFSQLQQFLKERGHGQITFHVVDGDPARPRTNRSIMADERTVRLHG